MTDAAVQPTDTGQTTPTGPTPPMHLTTGQMNDYARRAIEGGDLLAIDDHLAGCADCRSRMVDEEGLRATVTALQREIAAALPAAPDHLPYDQIEALAEDRLRGAAREIAETHVEDCTSCAAEIADLRGFVAAFRETRRVAAAALAAAAPAHPAFDRGGAPRPAAVRADRGDSAAAAAPSPDEAPLFSAARPATAARPLLARAPAVLAAAGFLAAVALAAAAWVLRGRVLDLKARMETLKQTNETLAGRAAEIETLRAALAQKTAETAPAAAPGAPAITLVDRNGAVGLDADGQLTGLDALPVAEGRVVAAALRHGRIEIPDTAGELILPPPSADVAAPAPLSPVGTAVRSQRPALSWDGMQGATAYSVVISDSAGSVVARADMVRGQSWTPSRPLRRGVIYSWRVAAAGPAPQAGGAAGAAPAAGAGAARFRVLDQAAITAIDRTLKTAGGSALVGAVVDSRAGLLDEAEKELRSLVQSNPDSPAARALLQSLLEERVRRTAAAR